MYTLFIVNKIVAPKLFQIFSFYKYNAPKITFNAGRDIFVPNRVMKII